MFDLFVFRIITRKLIEVGIFGITDFNDLLFIGFVSAPNSRTTIKILERKLIFT